MAEGSEVADAERAAQAREATPASRDGPPPPEAGESTGMHRACMVEEKQGHAVAADQEEIDVAEVANEEQHGLDKPKAADDARGRPRPMKVSIRAKRCPLRAAIAIESVCLTGAVVFHEHVLVGW